MSENAFLDSPWTARAKPVIETKPNMKHTKNRKIYKTEMYIKMHENI